MTGKLKLKFLVIFLLVIVFSLSSFAQNFDYQLQNTLERIYLNSDKDNKKDFEIFRKTFFSEGYQSFDYLSRILENDKKIIKDYPLFFQRVDSANNDIYRNMVSKMVEEKKIKNALVFSLDSLFAYLSNFEHIIPFVVKCVSNLYIALLAFFVIYGLLSLIRFFRLLSYDIKKILEKNGISGKLAFYMAIFVTLTFPVFLTVHIKFLPLYWLLVFFVYFSSKEKLVVYSAIVVIILVSFTGGFLNSFSDYFFKKKAFYYESLISPFSGVGYKTGQSGDYKNFAAGVSYLREDKPIEAVKILKLINSDSPLYKYALNNIGVSYIFLSRPKLALNFFEEAVKHGLNFQPNINKFYLNNKLYNIVEAEEALKSAYKSNLKGTAEWLQLNIKEAYPVIAIPSFFETLKVLLKDYSYLKSQKSLMLPVFFFVFLILLGLIQFVSRDFSITRSCKRCGTPFKVFESQNDRLCTQCSIMAKSKGEMSADMIEEKRKEIRFYSAIKRTFEIGLGAVLPGFYNICVLKRVFSGFILFLLSVITLLDCLNAYKVVGNFVVISPLIAIFVLLQFINLINIFFESEED